MEDSTTSEESSDNFPEMENFSNVCWNEKNLKVESIAINTLLDLWCEFWCDESPTPTQVDFGKFSEKPLTKVAAKSQAKNTFNLKPATKTEDSWQGLDNYKQQKILNMYPSWNLERQEMLLSQLYKRILLQRLQFTLSELDEYRKVNSLYQNQANQKSRDKGSKAQMSFISTKNISFISPYATAQGKETQKRRPNSAGSAQDTRRNSSIGVLGHRFLPADVLDIDPEQKRKECQELMSCLEEPPSKPTSKKDTEKITSNNPVSKKIAPLDPYRKTVAHLAASNPAIPASGKSKLVKAQAKIDLNVAPVDVVADLSRGKGKARLTRPFSAERDWSRVGVAMATDIADLQRTITNLYSE